MLALLSVRSVQGCVITGSASLVLTLAASLGFAQQTVAPAPDPGTGPQPSGPSSTTHSRPGDLLLRRLDYRTEGALREELLRAPEIDILDGRSGTMESLKDELGGWTATKKPVSGGSATAAGSSPVSSAEKPPLSLSFQRRRWEALGLEPLPDTEAQLDAFMRQSLERTATQMRRWGLVSSLGRRGQVSPPSLTRMSKNTAMEKQLSREQKAGSALGLVPVFVQMMQAEEEPSRLLLIEILAGIDHPSASLALARRAVYDTSARVREAALRALNDRPRPHYRPVLLDGLRYPWAPVADHAAEALVALQDREAVPLLENLLDLPEPGMPIRKPDTDPPFVVRELVRVNHFRNCLLCHAPPSFDAKDRLVAPVPTPGKEIPAQYYGTRRSTGDLLVRADVTYLRQDFSVMQPVADAAPWPDRQRYDFLVRQRPATAEELTRLEKPPATYPQREAVRFALKELSE
jgi:hypothetical protein